MSTDTLLLRDAERAAELATQRGRTDEAKTLWLRVLQIAPGHTRAIGFMAQLALRDGNAARARELLEPAVREHPKDPILWLALAHAYRRVGDVGQRLEALSRALSADPYCYPAMLEKACILEDSGRKRIAAQLFADALKIVPPDEALPGELLAFVQRGRQSVKDNALAFEGYMRTRLAPHAESGASFPARFEECLGIAAGGRKIYTQQPSLLYVPWLPAIPFYDRGLFPWLEGLEAATDVIRNEYLAASEQASDAFRPYVSHPEGAPVDQWAELNNSPRWNALHLWKSGERDARACAQCPKTLEAIKAVPVIEIENFAPTVLFSVLAPHTRLPPHSSVTNARLVIHLPLIVPERCGFRVGNEVREWRVGKAWVFDDTLNHEAWNDSDQYRVILLVDIWNPFLSEQERGLIGGLLNGMKDYYAD